MKINDYGIDEKEEYYIDIHTEDKEDEKYLELMNNLKEGTKCDLLLVQYEEGFSFHMKNRKNNNSSIEIEVPEMIENHLKYLEKNGYGSVSEIILSSGMIGNIIDIYNMVRQEEIRENNTD